MKVKIGNWSRDTMADKAITSPKSFPKCSEGKLEKETDRAPVSSQDLPSKEEPGRGEPGSATCSQVPCPRPGFTLPCPHSPSPLHLDSSHRTQKSHYLGTQTQAVPGEVSRERQTHKHPFVLAKEARTERQGDGE